MPPLSPPLSHPLSPTLYPTLSLFVATFVANFVPTYVAVVASFVPTFVANFVTIFATIFVPTLSPTFSPPTLPPTFSPPSGMYPAFHYLSLFMHVATCIATVPLRVSSKWRFPEIRSFSTGSVTLFTGLQHINLNKNLMSGDCWASDKMMWTGMLFLTVLGHELSLKLDKDFNFNELRERNLSYSHTTLLHGKERTMTTCNLRRPRALL